MTVVKSSMNSNVNPMDKSSKSMRKKKKGSTARNKNEKSKRETKSKRESKSKREKSMRKKKAAAETGGTTGGGGTTGAATMRTTADIKELMREMAKEVWPNEQAAKKLFQQNGFSNEACNKEFTGIPNDKPPADKCTDFTKNSARNRQASNPIANENRVKMKTPTEYVNAANVTIPDYNRTVIIAQLPDPSNTGYNESFWRMVFDETIVSIHIAYVALESPLCLNAIFPISSGSFSSHGKVFLNNKKVETIGKEITTYTLEVLPDGCSNATNVTIYHHLNWKMSKAPGNISDVVLACDKTIKVNENIMFCSLNGTGRAGTLLTIYSTMYQLSKNADVKVKETLVNLRKQRCGLVENQEQYTSIYQALGYHIKSKSSDDEMVKKLGEFVK